MPPAQDRILEAQREAAAAAERECTFVPAINSRSARLVAPRAAALKVGLCCEQLRGCQGTACRGNAIMMLCCHRTCCLKVLTPLLEITC